MGETQIGRSTEPVTDRLFIGLMSGISMDGIDGVLVRFAPSTAPEVRGHVSLCLPPSLRETLLALNVEGYGELQRAALAANELTRLYAQVVAELLDISGLPAAAITAIGAHGQTVRHRPELGFTCQLNAPALLAEMSGIDVVADFRSRDIAAGGQGAPLVPRFHAMVFGGRGPRAILNLGGIANVTLLLPGQPAWGFDTGPANILLDGWCQRHTGQRYDAGGTWAASGHADPRLLAHLLASEPWFALPGPKSTGRDLFNMAWLDQRLARYTDSTLTPQDIQATLQRLTAHTVAMAINAVAPTTGEILVCGGGAYNNGLLHALAECVQKPVRLTDDEGIPAQQVEALAFAWLAQAHIDRMPASLPTVTGAQGPRVLGALYPA